MAILVDYVCGSCGSREERWAPTPPPSSLSCSACGADSRRAWAAIGLAGRPAPAPPAGDDRRTPRRSLCAEYPTVPGLCHMSESAGRMWVAKYTNDKRAVDREQERQEKAATVRQPTMADAITHTHQDNGSAVGAAPPG